MKQLLLRNARIVLPHGIEVGSVLVKDSRIEAIYINEEPPSGLGQDETIDLLDSYLAPGMIDIHIHGSVGVDIMEAGETGLLRLSAYLATEGITGFFPTLVPAPNDDFSHAINYARRFFIRQGETSKSIHGARSLGIHFEGPFVNENKAGALRAEYFRTYDRDERSIDFFTDTLGWDPPEGYPPAVRIMTIAPEIEGGVELVRDLTLAGFRVFIGHTKAGAEILHRAVAEGALHVSHFPNALDPFHHRSPGASGWAMVRDDISIDCIVDFHHVHPTFLRILYKLKGSDLISFVSDAIKPAGLGDGEFEMWGKRIAVHGGKTSLLGAREATIAGSVISLRQALNNAIGLNIPLHEAVNMASLNPARAAGIDSHFGSIQEGKFADLISFDDDIQMKMIFINGMEVLDLR